jgi:hypothetical protein
LTSIQNDVLIVATSGGNKSRYGQGKKLFGSGVGSPVTARRSRLAAGSASVPVPALSVSRFFKSILFASFARPLPSVPPPRLRPIGTLPSVRPPPLPSTRPTIFIQRDTPGLARLTLAERKTISRSTKTPLSERKIPPQPSQVSLSERKMLFLPSQVTLSDLRPANYQQKNTKLAKISPKCSKIVKISVPTHN